MVLRRFEGLDLIIRFEIWTLDLRLEVQVKVGFRKVKVEL